MFELPGLWQYELPVLKGKMTLAYLRDTFSLRLES
jgi:hypothetical protein